MKRVKTTKAYRKNVSGHSPTECCARCGAYMPEATLYVVTPEGEIPVGPDCAEVLRDAGHEIVSDR